MMKGSCILPCIGLVYYRVFRAAQGLWCSRQKTKVTILMTLHQLFYNLSDLAFSKLKVMALGKNQAKSQRRKSTGVGWGGEDGDREGYGHLVCS